MQGSLNESLALIADDDPNIRAILSGAATLAGLDSVSVTNGREAVKMLADWRPAVALLAVQLPGLSGIEVCWWMRWQARLANVPVILVSALMSQDEIDAGILAGANLYMPRPFTCANIRAAIGRHLRSSPNAAPSP
jgi:DNA-binding response OmpR family regulator